MDGIATAPAADRRDLFTETASRRALSPVIIEKDFWVCWTLKQAMSLESIGPNLVFKGGTSLSKVFGLIQRFSEDIDLSIQRSYLGFAGESDPERAATRTKQRERVLSLRRACRGCVRTVVLPALAARFEGLLGPKGWSLALDETDADTLNFIYPSAAPERPTPGARSWLALPYIRPAVKLELGAGSDPYPVGNYPIRSYAAESFPQAFSNTDAECSVATLEAERTFWEKATLVHAEYHRAADKPTLARFSRHYYDLHQMALSEHGRRAVADRELLRRVAEHKQVYFASGWAHYQTAPTRIHLVPPDTRLKELSQDYARMREMFFGPFPTLHEILATLQILEYQINRR